jgi:hypothetical protein
VTDVVGSGLVETVAQEAAARRVNDFSVAALQLLGLELGHAHPPFARQEKRALGIRTIYL